MVLTKGITLWSTKIFLQNLHYRHKQNKKIPKYGLAYMRYSFPVISLKHIPTKCVIVKSQTLEK